MDKNSQVDLRKASNASSSFFSRAATYRSRNGDGNSGTGKGPLGLTTLYSPLERKAIADLVFIHGLDGGSK